MASRPRNSCLAGWRIAACAAAILVCSPARADMPKPTPGSTLTIMARTPDPEIRIRGVSLRSVHADDAQNEVAFDFNGPISEDIFSELQRELPEVIDVAFGGYDTAVIRSRKPVTFLTHHESDGFSLRMVARGSASTSDGSLVALRGDNSSNDAPPGTQPTAAPPNLVYVGTHGWQPAQTYFARAAAERPFDVTIRRGYDGLRDGDASVVSISGDWRHTRGTILASGTVHAEIAAWSDVRLLENFHDVVVNAKAVRQLNGTIVPFNKNDMSGSMGLGIPVGDAVATAEVLYGRSGAGGRLGLGETQRTWQLGLLATYHAPYTDTAEAVADRAERDTGALYASGEILDGLWGEAELDATRYGVHADADVARTAGFHANLRYDFDGWPLSVSYDGDGEYVLHDHKYAGVAPSPFLPLSIHDREMHAFSGAFSEAWDRTLWFDLYGGYAIDRYSDDGPFGGVALRFTPASGLDLMLNGRYSKVAERQGEEGNVLSADLTLTYAFAVGASDAPIMHAGPANDL